MSLLNYSHHYVGLITCCVNHLQILRNLRKKRILMEPDVNVHYAYCWTYMVTELIDTLSVKFFKIVIAKLKQPKRQIRVSRAYFPAILRYIERNEFIFFVIY